MDLATNLGQRAQKIAARQGMQLMLPDGSGSESGAIISELRMRIRILTVLYYLSKFEKLKKCAYYIIFNDLLPTHLKRKKISWA